MIGKAALVVLAVLVALVGYWVSQRAAVHAADVQEILSNPSGERAARTMVITLADGRIYPVNYLWEQGQIFMGIDGRWWRAFRDGGQPVELFVKGQTLTGHARVVLDDPAYVDDIFSRLRPTAPKWLPRWLNGKLVVIDLDDPALPRDAQGSRFKTQI